MAASPCHGPHWLPPRTEPTMTAPAIVRLDPPASAPATEPVLDRPRRDRLESGDPLRQTWTRYEAPQGDLSAGT